MVIPDMEIRNAAAQPVSTDAFIGEPILASTLLETLLRQRQRDVVDGKDGIKKVRIEGGVKDLDEYVLLGGVEKGEVVGISADSKEGVGRLISLHLLASALLSNPDAKAIIIDTTGSFPIILLASVLQYHLTQKFPLSPTEVAEQRVRDLLDRVSISRVFDIEGVWEVISEISEEFRFPLVQKSSSPDPNDKQAIEKSKETEKAVKEIEDSEGEDDDDDLDVHSLHSQEARLEAEKQQLPITRGRTEIVIIDNMTMPISSLFSQREKDTAHTLLAALSRTLTTLSRQHSILTILLNDIITPNTAYTNTESINVPNQNPPPRDPYPTAVPFKNPNATSIFTTNTIGAPVRPSLGRLFTDLLTLHFLITSVPLTRHDAEILYTRSLRANNTTSADADADTTSTSCPPELEITNRSLGQPKVAKRNDKDISYGYVLEVLKDETSDFAAWEYKTMDGVSSVRRSNGDEYDSRDGTQGRTRIRRGTSREQRWGAFVLGGDGGSGGGPGQNVVLRDPFLRPGDGAKALLGWNGNSNIAKTFPFGRRA